MAFLRRQPGIEPEVAGPEGQAQAQTSPLATGTRTPAPEVPVSPVEDFWAGMWPDSKTGKEGRASETPRMRQPQPNQPTGAGPGDGARATPGQPRVPTPVSATPGVLPFKPMPSGGNMAQPRLRGLYGSLGGLQGGGLGVPLDPTPNEVSDPLALLAPILAKMKGLF